MAFGIEGKWRDALARAMALWGVAGMLAAGACGGEEGPMRSRGGVSRAGAAGGGSLSGTNPLDGTVPVLPADSASGSTGSGGCQPGHYVGSFDGIYNSAAWGNGSVPLSIAAVASMGRPGLEFWLEKVEGGVDCAGIEFCADYTVKGGKIRGFADPFSDGSDSEGDMGGFVIAVPFEIDFGGELDCSSGQFRGLLQNGCYDVATFLFRFDGTAPATYEPASSSFVDGQWTVKEIPMPNSLWPPDANIGGMGKWEASLVNDNTTPVTQGGGLCARP